MFFSFLETPRSIGWNELNTFTNHVAAYFEINQ